MVNLHWVYLTFRDIDNWGYPIRSAPSGVELWAWFEKGTKEETDEKWVKGNRLFLTKQRWLGLQRALGGLFSASLNFMDLTNTVEPGFTFDPEGDLHHSEDEVHGSHGLRYAVLPREVVCTENLTPYLRQLPCRQYNGIAQLLQQPTNLYRTHYHSMGIHYVTQCVGEGEENCSKRQLVLTQTLTLVFNPSQDGRPEAGTSRRMLFT